MNAFTYIDIIAFIYFIVSIIGYGWLTQYGALNKTNISKGVHEERKTWMNVMIERENRMLDMLILTNLSQGNAFFASTAIVIAGALATSLGSSHQFNSVLEHIPLTEPAEPYVFNIKLLIIMLIFLIAFFKFAWAFRLTHYTSIMVGATPLRNEDNLEQCKAHAERVASIAGLAGHHSNGGLHTYYYGIAACGWLFSPYLFIFSTTLVILVLYRREYKSRSHAILSKLNK